MAETDIVNSIVVPVYRNAESITPLVATIQRIANDVDGELEAVFVIDGSPDDSRRLLTAEIAATGLRAQVIDHSRNFGALAAVRTGMIHARGSRIAVMAADLQEPPELIIQFFRRLASGEVDVLAGERVSRDDRGDLAAKTYWRLYQRFVMPDIPSSGVDVFACTDEVRDVVCSLESVHTSLVAQLFWIGFRRELVPYDRLPRPGESGWTFGRKLRYLADSVFAFTDMPVQILWTTGAAGLLIAAVIGAAVLVGRLAGAIHVPGYAATILVLLFFASLNLFGLGIIGSYVWRTYEITKGRPGGIVREVREWPARDGDA
jgi:glycosyltransferase involved in cell wall biosynthesis